MKAFNDVNKELRKGFSRCRKTNQLKFQKITSESISSRIRELICVASRRESGTFFTGEKLAKQALKKIESSIDTRSVFFDPTCGAGELLIAASEYLPVYPCLDKTLAYWSTRLAGVDLYSEFVRCTKLRLIQRAVERGAVSSKYTLAQSEQKFDLIVRANIFSRLNKFPVITHVLLNPPYVQRTLFHNRTWSKGRINMAAVFVQDILGSCEPGTKYVAILPEVLRSGSRYEKWREIFLSQLSTATKAEIVGKFDKSTDVDVFIVSGKTRSRKVKFQDRHMQAFSRQKSIRTVAEYFDVRIGPLVAYRDPETGPRVPYANVRCMNLWGKTDVSDMRRTNSKLFMPPFVVVNRTSTPSDKHRARASIVVGSEFVSVENHLVVLAPKVGGIEMCEKLVLLLRNKCTNDFLNARIRCRHLTVSAIKEIPWVKK